MNLVSGSKQVMSITHLVPKMKAPIKSFKNRLGFQCRKKYEKQRNFVNLRIMWGNKIKMDFRNHFLMLQLSYEKYNIVCVIWTLRRRHVSVSDLWIFSSTLTIFRAAQLLDIFTLHFLILLGTAL